MFSSTVVLLLTVPLLSTICGADMEITVGEHCKRFVIFTRRNSGVLPSFASCYQNRTPPVISTTIVHNPLDIAGGTHLVEVLNSHPGISVLKDFPAFALQQIKANTALAAKMGDTEEVLDTLLKSNDWVHRGFQWAAARKAFNETFPEYCAVGMLFMDHFVDGYKIAKYVIEDTAITKIVFERENVTALYEAFRHSQQ
eukprot:6334071-Pyramimonas_sp.AAC.1